uniref:Uncharacterized protein n=1 Tax=Romanomermis culicivorax TaxID=13658 RepID=A0A915K855_ROMCU
MDNPARKNIPSQKFTEIRPTELGSSLSITHSHLPSSSDTSVIKWGQQQQHGHHHPQHQLNDKEPPQLSKQPSALSRHVTAEESMALLPAAGAVSAAGSISAAGSDIEIDDVKSTGSSHPFSSPNPSEFDDHAASFTSSNPDHLSITAVGETKRHYKRRKHCDASSTSSTAATRLAYPLSERQQMARLMKLTAPESHPDKPKSPASCGGPPMHHISGAHSSYFGSIGQTTPGCHGSAGFTSCGAISASAATSLFSPSSPSTQQTVTPPHKVRGKMAKIFRRNDRGETFLHLAAKRGDKKQCEELIKEGADVNAVDYAGSGPKGAVETLNFAVIFEES